MVTLNRVQPILATFTVPGQHLQAIFQYRAKGSLTVFAVEQATGQQPLTGTLVFIDNTVDPTTGVIRLKASFANEDRRLWPGQLIDVRLHLFDRAGCVVVPSQAVQAGQQGTYVYVVKEDQTVAYRSVRSGMLYEGETVIEEGLAAGERVVIDGQMQLADGVKIEERGRGGEKKGQETPAEGKQGKS
jgi:multidrug efflux system membrane fusion protein